LRAGCFVDLSITPRAANINAMGIVQKIHGENTFGELSGEILRSILNHICKSQQVYVVFDVNTEGQRHHALPRYEVDIRD
jgi:hypothetical protein